MSTEAPYGSGENYRPLVRRFAATVDADTRPENEGEEGSPIKHWAAAGYSGFVPFQRSTLADTFRASVENAESEWQGRSRDARCRNPTDSPPRELVGFNSAQSMSATFGQRSPEPTTPEPKYHIPGYTGYIPANKNISSRGYSAVTRAAFNSHGGIDTELIRSSGELIMEPNRAAPGCLPARPNNIGEPTMSHPWCYVGPS